MKPTIHSRIRWQQLPVVLFLAILFCTMNGLHAATNTSSQDLQACSAQEPPGLTDETMRYRLRAYANLDCLMGRLEEAMKRSGGRNDQVRLSREEVQQLFNLAAWAKDAAQRIAH
jgi:hypothetical protein